MFKMPNLDIQQILTNPIRPHHEVGLIGQWWLLVGFFTKWKRGAQQRTVCFHKPRSERTAIAGPNAATDDRPKQHGWSFVRAKPTHRAIAVVLTFCAVMALVSAPRAQGSITVMALFKDRAMVLINGKQRLLKIGKPSPEGLLLIEADSDLAVIEHAGKRRDYRLGRRINTKFAKPAAGVSTTIWPDQHGMYMVVGSINGFPVSFLVDTGATYVAMSRGQARRLGIDYEIDGKPGASSTAAGIVRSYSVHLAKVKIGEIELRDIRATVIDADAPRQVLLGNSFLNRLRMHRDGAAMVLTKP